MKFLLAIAMLTLAGLSATSAAAINVDDKVLSGSMEEFKENLQNMLHAVTQQIEETANADESMDIEEFIRENTLEDDASMENDFADDELTVVEEDESTDNVEGGIRCAWRGLSGRCCQSVRIVKIRLSICLTAAIAPPTSFRASLTLNGHTIWRRTIVNRHSYQVCLKKSCLRLCIHIYNVGISSHSAQACLGLTGKFHFIHFSKSLGCFRRYFASNETLAAEEVPLQITSKQEHSDDTHLNPKRRKPTDNVLRFEH